MKRLIAVILSMLFLLSLVACNSGGGGTVEPSDTKHHRESVEYECYNLFYSVSKKHLCHNGHAPPMVGIVK